MDTKIYLSIMAALASAAVLALVALVAAPLANPIAWALIIGVATMPHYARLRARLRSPTLSAGAMLFIILLCLVAPLTLLVVITEQNATEWLRESEKIFTSLGSLKVGNVLHRFPLVTRVLSLAARAGVDISGYAAQLATSASQYVVDAATSAAKNLAGLLFTLTLTLFILFFLYRDGEELVAAAVSRCGDRRQKVRYYLSEMRATTTAVVVGTIFTSLVQGGLAGIAYFLADTPLPILFGVLTAGAGLLPVVGTAVIWVPLCAYLTLNGAYIKALLLALWCFVVVIAITDNVIRPLAVGAQRGNIPALAVVLGAVGGVLTMGVLGLIAGPILLGLVVLVWRDVTGGGPGGARWE